MGAAVARARSPRRSHQSKDIDLFTSGDKLQEAGVHQLLVKNLQGKSITLDADLDEDVSHLACAFIVHEGLQAASHLSLRFTFSGRRLEQGVPLRHYGLVRGSTVQAFPCPSGRSRTPPGAGRQCARCAWGEASGQGQGMPQAVVSSPRGAVWSEAEAVRQDPEALWVEFPTTITTPFAQVNATLEFPERYWEACRLSPRVLRRMVRMTEVLGAQGSRDACPSDCSWRLRMNSLHPFPGIQPPAFSDIWQRLQATPARVDVSAPEGGVLKDARPLVNEDDELVLGNCERKRVGGLRFCVSLLRDAEVAVDDVTVMFREADGASSRDICSVCLEPMLAGDMCRRLACLHCLHAGCAMTLLPAVPCCPVCRISITSTPGSPDGSAAEQAVPPQGTVDSAGPATPGVV
mmetsp:Transcript_89818/g.262534  ORF Transcript_89818/g.262534 Transcript_89818/m.262534 type:complete len:405 (-) Transcript_89818:35-1249(-)